MGSTQLTANGLNTVGTKVTLNRVMVHLGFQLHGTFCRLPFSPRGKSWSFPTTPHRLSPQFLLTFSCHPFSSEVIACTALPGQQHPSSQSRHHPGACRRAALPSRSKLSQFRALPVPLPSPIACEASCYSFNGFIDVYIDLMAEAGRLVRYHKPTPPNRQWDATPRTHRQWRQSQDSLPTVIIFALYRDLSHAAATTWLQDTKAMKTRLMKSVCEPFSLA